MATCTFIQSDTATNGNWVGVYGSDGWFLEGDSPQSSYPSYITTPAFSGWSGPFDAGANTDTRALQKASNNSVRSDSLLYTGSTATIDFTVTGSKYLTFYVWAGDAIHGQSVTILDEDNAGATLDTRSIPDNYTNGTYLTWQVSGHIRISVTSTSGANGGRVSGLFFGVTAAITGLSPSALFPGTTQTVTVSGLGTSFTSGTTTVSISGTGVTVGTVTVASTISLTVALTTSSGASLGSRTLTVTTGSEAPTKTIHVGAAYWRLNITQGDPSANSIAEWTFTDASSSPIATTGGTASASSAAGGDPASNAFDGNASTFWASSGTPAWLQYQFSSEIAPASFAITTRSDLGSQVPFDIAIQYSGDGALFTPFYSYFGLPWTNTNGQTISLTSSNAAPNTVGISWRLLITADSASQSTSIAEIVFYDNTASQINTSRYAAITSSTYTDSGGSFAFDGSGSTVWASIHTPSTGSPEWIGYRFSDASIYPATFSIEAPASGQYAQSPSAFKLQSSLDEITWTDVQTYTPASWTSNNQTQTFTVSSAPSPISNVCIFVVT